MLQSLNIKNVVLIDKLDLDIKSGLSVLTGETGAGKSILLDSLGLVLGNRADTSLIRHGEDKLSVSATFSVSKNHPVHLLFEEHELEKDAEINIKRTLDRDGKGKIFINDQPISAKLLKDIGRQLVEIHGQFDNQGLLNQANHLDILDNYGGYHCLLAEVKEKFLEYKSAKQERIEAEENLKKSLDEEESLRHWVGELTKLKPTVGEEESLTQKRLELMNAEKIIESLNFAHSAITQGADIQNAIRQAQGAIARANHLVEGKYDEIANTLEQALIYSNEAASQIEDASSNIGLDGNELNDIEERLFSLRAVARKHQVSIDELPDTLELFRRRLSSIELGEEGVNELKKIEDTKKKEYLKSATDLSSIRKHKAQELDAKVMQELPPLKMEKAKFITIIEQTENLVETGFDNVSFTVSTNPNSPQGAISKIASGGELARFMLALKVNLAKSSPVGVMIFDEVDSGIGGATAQAVGERLARLSEEVQVLVVTHSPQVAGRGTHHFKVEKNTKNNITTTEVKELNKNEREEEIARMLAGETISDEARAAARVLISQ